MNLCRLLAFRDVADRAGDKHSLFGLQRAQADLNRELAPIFAQTKELDARAHGAHPGISKKTGAVAGVLPPEALGNQNLNRLIQQLLPFIAKQLLGLCVHQDDLALLIDNDHRIRCCL